MVDQRRVEALTKAQGAAGLKLLTRFQSLLRPAMRRLGSSGWYAPVEFEPVVKQFAAVSAQAESARAAVAVKFTVALLRELGEDVTPPIVDTTGLRGGVDPLEVWSRPVKEYRYQVSQGKSPADALAAATARADRIADDNLQLADRKASQEVMSLSAITVGYRRVIHPELSQGGTCGLCIAASTRKYKVEEPRAIHARCKCTSVPITTDDDIGDIINSADLKQLYKDNAGSADGQKLKYLRYQINEHGELGPVITRKGDNFRDATDVAHDLGKPVEVPTNLDAKSRDAAVRELEVLLNTPNPDPKAVRAKRAEISRLNRANK